MNNWKVVTLGVTTLALTESVAKGETIDLPASAVNAGCSLAAPQQAP